MQELVNFLKSGATIQVKDTNRICVCTRCKGFKTVSKVDYYNPNALIQML